MKSSVLVAEQGLPFAEASLGCVAEQQTSQLGRQPQQLLLLQLQLLVLGPVGVIAKLAL